MKKLKNIKKFFLIKAQYYIEDKRENNVLLKIDYWNGKFNLTELGKNDFELGEIKKEAEKIALDLLKRKSRINLARKIE